MIVRPAERQVSLSGDDQEAGTPEWWLRRLIKQLDARQAELKHYDDYYNGIQRMAFASKKFRQAFGDLFAEFSDNFCALVVDAVAERLTVQGFRMGGIQDDAADTDAWRIWQANQLDAQSQMAHVEAMVKSVAYVHVSPFKDDWVDPMTPGISIEDPMACIVELAAGNRRKRRAALKRWVDDETGLIFANVYLPDQIVKFQSTQKVTGTPSGTALSGTIQWEPRAVEGETWPLPNPLGEVYILPLSNRLRVDGTTRSEIDEAIAIQDGVNKLVSDMMLASEFGAFPQKWALNLVLEEDPDTGKVKQPFDIAVDKLLTVPPPEGGEPPVQFGQFQSTDLSQYVKAIEMLIQQMASITRTPAHYLLGQSGSFPSGESLKSAETGLVTKARWRMQQFGETWEDAIRLAFKVLEDDRSKVVDSETIWRDPESRTEAERSDALVKRAAIGVPLEQLWSDAGYTPQQIARFKQMRAEEASLGSVVTPRPGPVGETGPTGELVGGPIGGQPAVQDPGIPEPNPAPQDVPASPAD